MTRPHRDRPSIFRPTLLLFPLLMALIGWFVFSRGEVVSPSPVRSEGGRIPAPTSTQILLGLSQQNADRDAEFIYTVETQTLTPTSTEKGFRLPIALNVSLTRHSEDGVWLLTGSDWSVAMRDSRGNAYQDPLLVGAFDETRFAVAVIQSDRRVLLSVAKTGIMSELAVLSDQTVPLTMQDGRVWFVESAPQEGIEIPPHGPSKVWSMDISGATSTVVTDERVDTLVTDVVARGKDIALISDKKDIRTLLENGMLSDPVQGKPLGWLADHRLVIGGSNVPDGVRWMSILP